MDLGQGHLIIATIVGFLMACGIGANDVSNAMGTSVGSKAITVRQAVIIAIIFEFLGSFIAGGQVASTISHGLLTDEIFSNPNVVYAGMLSSLLAAATWLAIATYFAWPVSTTHTIVGAVIGFGWVQVGMSAIKWVNVSYILVGWIISPLLGGVISFAIFHNIQKVIFSSKYPLEQAKKIVPYYIYVVTCVILLLIMPNFFRSINIKVTFFISTCYALALSLVITLIGKLMLRRVKFDMQDDIEFHFTNVEKIFSVLMLFTSCAMAFAHGSNDVANAIGPLSAIAAVIGKTSSVSTPLWVLLLGAFGIVIGLSAYGHRVIATIGTGITELTPTKGFAATIAAASTVVFASNSGLPISTTHTMVGAILGIGIARGINAINMRNVRNIFMSWMVTLPAGTLLAIIYFEIIINSIL